MRWRAGVAATGLLVPQARGEMDRLMAQVMSRELGTGPIDPGEVKFEVARRLGVP